MIPSFIYIYICKLFQEYPHKKRRATKNQIIGNLIQVSGHVTSQSRVAPKYQRRQLLGPAQMAGFLAVVRGYGWLWEQKTAGGKLEPLHDSHDSTCSCKTNQPTKALRCRKIVTSLRPVLLLVH